ncbi:conserved hypothethical protein [Ralstonia solanacearum PSI07]|uniref:Conserved hypothethical protein n=1 Tax=blood disease bacterium R229 TaxID=741978 RepID=G2ZW34_9RALS|nr:conserved hypothethical protein [Ralstonia solanacearum PSI07]CCA83322.1 conserved hypothethical protein [blood disease bacterium R229]
MATARGADIALRLLLKAEAIRESVVRSLQATAEQDEEAPQASVERLAVLH